MPLSRDPEKRARQVANLRPGLKEGQSHGSRGIRGAPEGPPSPGGVDTLAEMEAVLMSAESEDVTPYRKSLRKLYREDFGAFQRLMTTERNTRAKARPAAVVEERPETKEEFDWHRKMEGLMDDIGEQAKGGQGGEEG